MKKSIIIFSICLMSFTFMFGCTQQQRAEDFGGTTIIDLPVGQKLVMATWKQSDLWYLTRPFRPGEVPEVQTFQESSSFGVLNGKVVFKEH